MGAEGGISLVRATLLADRTAAVDLREAAGEQLSEVASVEQASNLGVYGIRAVLQSDDMAYAPLASESGHLLGLHERRAERPLAVDMLPSGERRHDHLVVEGDANRHRDEIDIGALRQFAIVVKGVGRTEVLRRLLCRLAVGGADGHQLEVRECVDHSRVDAASPSGVHVRANQSDSDRAFCHQVTLSTVACYGSVRLSGLTAGRRSAGRCC